MSKLRSEIVCVVLALAALGCADEPCVRQSDCTSGLVCHTGRCISPNDGGPSPDVGAPRADAGRDAFVAGDTGPHADAGSSSMNDAGADGG